MPSLGTHRVDVGEIGGDVLRQLVFDLVLLFYSPCEVNAFAHAKSYRYYNQHARHDQPVSGHRPLVVPGGAGAGHGVGGTPPSPVCDSSAAAEARNVA